VRVLVRQLAVHQLLYSAEKFNRLVFGSQVNVLRGLNEHGSLSELAIIPVYEKAKLDYPSVYSGYSFENWIGFLLTQGVVRRDANNYQITAFGQYFLSWLVHNNVSVIKAN